MVNYNGAMSFLLAAQESTFNTPVAVNKSLGITGTYDFDGDNNVIQVRGIGNRETQKLLAGNFDGKLAINGELNSGAILEMFFGQATDTATSTDYTHVFINSAGSETVKNTLNSFTIAENFDSSSDITHTWGGCAVNIVDLSIAMNETIKVSAEILCADEDTGTTAGTKVVTTTTPLTFAQCTLSAGAESSEAALTQVQNFKISFNNNLDYNDIRGIGSRLALGVLPKNLDVTGEFTMRFQDKVQAERFLGGALATTSTPADTGFIFQAHNGVTLGSGRVELYIRGWDAVYESMSRNVATDGIVEETFRFRIGTLKDVKFVDAVSTYF